MNLNLETANEENLKKGEDAVVFCRANKARLVKLFVDSLELAEEIQKEIDAETEKRKE